MAKAAVVAVLQWRRHPSIATAEAAPDCPPPARGNRPILPAAVSSLHDPPLLPAHPAAQHGIPHLSKAASTAHVAEPLRCGQRQAIRRIAGHRQKVNGKQSVHHDPPAPAVRKQDTIFSKFSGHRSDTHAARLLHDRDAAERPGQVAHDGDSKRKSAADGVGVMRRSCWRSFPSTAPQVSFSTYIRR